MTPCVMNPKYKGDKFHHSNTISSSSSNQHCHSFQAYMPYIYMLFRFSLWEDPCFNVWNFFSDDPNLTCSSTGRSLRYHILVPYPVPWGRSRQLSKQPPKDRRLKPCTSPHPPGGTRTAACSWSPTSKQYMFLLWELHYVYNPHIILFVISLVTLQIKGSLDSEARE